ncbi:hypothetical protein [Benzoatithermus flavus]|uniref:Lipoprotein n=1 Tax=Benzoatithermus flavus TaxID=3108223 RepID=A0ABU8XQB9_9PROT
MPRRPSSLLGAAILLGVAACASVPVETDRTVAGDPAEVRSRIEAEIIRLGFTRTTDGTSGVVTASRSGTPAAWMSCVPEIVGQEDPERRMVTVQSRHGTVRVTLEPAAGGTRVVIATDFTGTYRNPYTTYPFEKPCRSTGVVESRLFAAASAGPTS